MAGYIGTTPVPQATQHRESFTATGGQTSFATAGYTPQFIDVYLNGVKLAPADFTATNGSDVVLASGATASDILEIVAYTPFEVANQTFTGTTTAANLTVTGAFTSQGIDDNADAVAITINSSENVGIGTSSPDLKLDVSHNVSSEYVATFQNTADNLELKIGTTSGLLNIQGANASNNTPYEIALNAEGGNVGIGTSSPSSYYANHLVVDTGSSAQSGITIVSDTGNQGMFAFADGTSGDARYRGAIDYNHSNDSMAFLAAGTERMRLDASGNLLVGKTTIATGTAGVALRSNGEVRGTVSGAEAARFSRLSSDGAIVGFEKDGSTVGSIGTSGGDLIIGTGDTGLKFFDGGDSIFPVDQSTGNNRDSAVDIGYSSVRFKDLYLSGGVYLGGTGSANKLDDYEEGTWTPVSDYGTLTSVTATYTKIGNSVFIRLDCTMPSTSSSSIMAFAGLPFSTAQDGSAQMGVTNSSNYNPSILLQGTTCYFYGASASAVAASTYSGALVRFTGQYNTTA